MHFHDSWLPKLVQCETNAICTWMPDEARSGVSRKGISGDRFGVLLPFWDWELAKEIFVIIFHLTECLRELRNNIFL